MEGDSFQSPSLNLLPDILHMWRQFRMDNEYLLHDINGVPDDGADNFSRFYNWFREWLVVCLVPDYYMSPWQFLVSTIIWKQFQWNLNKITANVTGSKMSSIKWRLYCFGANVELPWKQIFGICFNFTEICFCMFGWPQAITSSDDSLAPEG